jgi:hypothetical protein
MLQHDADQLAARQSDLVAKVWPDGISTYDLVVLEAVPLAVREGILDRLEAVWRADRGEPLAPLAELAGLKRAAFFNLRRAWRTHSLAGLVPHESRGVRRVSAGENDPLRVRAAELLRDDPVRRNVDIAKTIMDGDHSLVGDDAGPHEALTVLQRLERLVRDQRRRLVGDPVFVRGAYGSGLVLDLTAVSIVLKGEKPSMAVAAILMETSSGFVMGSALGAKEDDVKLQRDALVAGLNFLMARKADLPPSAAHLPDFGVMLPTGVSADRVADAIRPYVDEIAIGRVGGFSFGQQVVQVVGQRIGRMPLNPRRTLSFDVDEFLKSRIAPTVTLDEGRAIWAREVERHNAERIAALEEAGIVDGGLVDGRLAAVIRALLEALQPS